MSKVKTGLGIEDIIGDKRDAVLQLAAKYGATHIRIFGSVARHEARPDSDIDFLVTFPADKTVFDLVGFWSRLTDLMGREVDVITDGAIPEELRDQILEDCVPL